MSIEKPSLADHHTHAQDICLNNEEAAKAFGINVGDHLYKNVEAKKFIEHVTNNNLDTIWLIYEDKEKYISIGKAIKELRPSCEVNGFYFIRNPQEININDIDDLHKKGLLNGIKIHPVIDNYPLLPIYLDKVMCVAMKYGIPVIFHSDDRTRSMNLTSPKNQIELVSTYPDVRVVIGHGGAYANPRLVGENNTAAQKYWMTRSESIKAALNLALKHLNVFYEFSVVTNTNKAKLIVQFIEDHPSVVEKIIAGSDYPTINARLDSQIRSLKNAGLSNKNLDIISSNRL